MKFRLNTLFLSLTLLSQPVFAEHPGHSHAGETMESHATSPVAKDIDCKNAVQVKVNGLVCDFCARALEKVFSKREEVDHIKVDLAAGNVTIALKPGASINDATVKELITNSGYDVTGISKGC